MPLFVVYSTAFLEKQSFFIHYFYTIMKNIIFSRIHGSIFLLVLTLIAIHLSCTKENNNESVVSDTSIQAKASEYNAKEDEATHKSMVKTAAIGLLELSKQVSFRSTVNAAVALKFDKDDNALLKTLNKMLVSAGETELASQFSTSIASNHEALSVKEVEGDGMFKDNLAFTDISNITKTISGYTTWGSTAYLQIYIPHVKDVNLSQQPVVAFVYSDGQPNCETTGYQLDANGVWQVIVIDETFAENNLVWIVSANERVDDQGVVEAQFGGNDGEQGQITGAVTSRANENYICEIKTIEVWDRKECWYCGEADASIIGAAIRTSDCSGKQGFNEKNFKNISRFEVGDLLNCSTNLIKAAYLVKVDFSMGFVWYEKDWVNTQVKTLSTCSTQSKFTFKSKDSPWAVQNYSTLWSEPIANDELWHDTAFSYPAEVNQSNFNIITFRWIKSVL
jgi:hypothetical protein